MPLHENEGDRSNQAEVAYEFHAYLDSHLITGTGIDGISYWKFIETLQELALPHDYDLHHHGKYVGVLEVKCREGIYTRDYLWKNGVLMETGLLNAMRVGHHRCGRHVIFAIRSADGVILLVSLVTLMKNRDQFTKAPDGATKDNHGENPVDRAAVIVPISLFTEI